MFRFHTRPLRVCRRPDGVTQLAVRPGLWPGVRVALLPGVIRTAHLALLAALAIDTGCAAGVLPPSRTDVGTTVIAGSGQIESGLRFSTGAHLASGSIRRDAPLDIGAGYVFQRVARSPVSSEARALASAGAGPVEDAGDADDHADAQGAYVEFAHTIDRGSGHRSWMGARGEILARDAADGVHTSAGAYARLAWELFTPSRGAGVYAEGCGAGAGFAYGTAGLGLFVEAGTQFTEGERAAFVATAGLSLRLPLVGGFAFNLCPHC